MDSLGAREAQLLKVYEAILEQAQRAEKQNLKPNFNF